MSQLKLSKAFTLMESGPVVLVTTHDGKKNKQHHDDLLDHGDGFHSGICYHHG